MPELETGCLMTPEPLGTTLCANAMIDGMLGAQELPKRYIVPAFAHWFDEDGRPIKDRVWTLLSGEEHVPFQSWLDRCVGEACALQKTSHEKTFISAKDIWAITKRIDESHGHPKSAWGATIASGQEASIEGPASEQVVPSTVGTMSREQHMDESWVNSAVTEDRKKHSGDKTYFVTRDKARAALFATKHPVVTSLAWYSSDDAVDADSPYLPNASGAQKGGHCTTLIGWTEEGDIMTNSFGKDWGVYGLCFVRPEQMQRFGNMHIHVDQNTKTLAELLALYDGKDVQVVGTPDYYRCELGVLRKYPNEIVWWAHKKAFGINVYDMPKTDFIQIHKGDPMRIEDGEIREIIRQVRQHFGAA